MEKQVYKSASQKVREAVKALGYSNKQVSVVSRNVHSVNVGIKDISVDFEAVNKAAHEFESVSYCEFSQEILSGGNTFVFVEYPYSVQEAIWESEEFKKFVGSFEKELNELPLGQGLEISHGYVVFKGYNGGYQVKINGDYKNWHSIRDLAFGIFVKKAQKKLN